MNLGIVNFDRNEKASWPVLLANLMDEDLMPGTDDDIGYCYIWTADSAHSFNSIEKITPTWNQIMLPKSGKPKGQLLTSFYFIEETQMNKLNTKQICISPETKLYTFEIFCLGLRGLKPKGLMPIKKPFISFDLCSLNQNTANGTGSFLKNIKTNPNNKGENPNITAIIKFEVELPVDNTFMPELQCSVFDLILAGLLDSMLGVFVIPIEEIITSSNLWIQQFNYILRQILQDTRKQTVDLLDEAVSNEMNTKLKSKQIIEPLEIQEDNEKTVEIEDESKNEIKEKLLKEEGEEFEKRENYPERPNKRTDTFKDQRVTKMKVATGENILLYPVYTFIETPKKGAIDGETKKIKVEDESQKPDLDEYMEIGWNRTDEDVIKHYRRYYGTSLEQVKELNIKTPFDIYYINRGESNDESTDSCFFDAVRNIDSKILKRYSENEAAHEKVNKALDSYGRQSINVANDVNVIF